MSQSKRRAQYRAKGLPDPGPTPTVEMAQIAVVLPRAMADAIDRLHATVQQALPSRNDFLVGLIATGLQGGMAAAEPAPAPEPKRAPTTGWRLGL